MADSSEDNLGEEEKQNEETHQRKEEKDDNKDHGRDGSGSESDDKRSVYSETKPTNSSSSHLGPTSSTGIFHTSTPNHHSASVSQGTASKPPKVSPLKRTDTLSTISSYHEEHTHPSEEPADDEIVEKLLQESEALLHRKGQEILQNVSDIAFKLTQEKDDIMDKKIRRKIRGLEKLNSQLRSENVEYKSTLQIKSPPQWIWQFVLLTLIFLLLLFLILILFKSLSIHPSDQHCIAI